MPRPTSRPNHPMPAKFPSPPSLATPISIGGRRRMVLILGSARLQRAGDDILSSQTLKIVSAECRNQHAISVRSPEKSLALRPLFHLRRHDRNGVFARFNTAAGLIRINLSELGAEEQDLRGIINPEQQRDERAGRAIGGSRR